MSIDIQSEKLISFSELASSLPRRRNGKKTHLSTVHRWRAIGLAGGIKLDAVMVGGVWVTSWEAFRKFTSRVTAAKSGSIPTDPTTQNPGSTRQATSGDPSDFKW